ncbi:MAG: ParB/RepB/Spo0J family partition protein [Candidatus Firestonebacteria bacterium]
MAKQALGRGLSALIQGSNTKVEEKTGILEIPINKIKQNKYQPRRNFDTDKLKELINSIKEKGVIQPVLVRHTNNDFYELIAGERRLRAVQALGLKAIPAIIKDANDEESLEIALIENINRADLNAIEEAQAYKQLIEEFKLTQEEISKKVGKDRATIANILRLLKLPAEIQQYVSRGTIDMGHARALLSLDTEKEQKAVAFKIINRNLNVRQTEQLVSSRKTTTSHKIHSKKSTTAIEYKALEEELQRLLGTKVRLYNTNKGGHIEISYYSDEDLERIVELIKH